MTPERIAEIRAIIDGTSGVFSNESPRTIKAIIPIFATQSLPQALDTIEAQQRRIEELEAALSIKIDDARAFAASAVFVITQADAPDGQNRAARIVAEAFPNVTEKDAK